MLDATLGQTRERASIKELRQYFKWLTEAVTEQGFEDTQAKKRSWQNQRSFIMKERKTLPKWFLLPLWRSR